MKGEIVSNAMDTKNFSPAFLVTEEHAHYMNMCAIEIFTYLWFPEKWRWNETPSEGTDLKMFQPSHPVNICSTWSRMF